MDYGSDIGEYLKRLCDVLDSLDRGCINDVMNALMAAYEREATIYIFGNGGSASTASHFVCDFNKGVSMNLDKKFRFVCLNDNVPVIMAISNDCGYEHVFSMQLHGKLRPDDLVFAISGSGNSKNVIEAVEYAKSIGCKVIGFSGYDGGKLNQMADYKLHVPINDMQKVEDTHMIANHLIAQILAKRFGHPMC